MAERQSMTIDEVVRKVMVDEHAYALRESVALVVQRRRVRSSAGSKPAKLDAGAPRLNPSRRAPTAS
jgi:hypothetical protein